MPNITPGSACTGLWIAWAAYWFAASRFVERAKSSESRLARLAHTGPLATGAALISYGSSHQLLSIPPWNPGLAIQWAGVAFTAFGILYSIWARIHLGRYWSANITLKEGHRLIQSGPYRFTRHPIYTGLYVALAGAVVTVGTLEAVLGAAIMMVSFYFKSRREEAYLGREFGQDYEAYRARVKGLIPFVF